MQFQIQKDDYFEHVNKRLLFLVSKFKPVFEVSDGQYPMFGEFGAFLVKNINDTETLDESAKFILEAVDKGKHKTKYLIIQQVFEQVYCDKKAAKKLEEKLSGKALEIFIQEQKRY